MKNKLIKQILAISIVLTLLISFIPSLIQTGGLGQATGRINISFEGIGKGLDPKGNTFDINEIKSKKVLMETLKAAGIEGKYTVGDLRKCIVLKPVVAKNALIELTKISSVSGKTENIVQSSVNTGNYIITVRDISATRPLSGKKLGDSLVEEYKKYFKNNYLVDASIKSVYDEDEIFKLDYPEMLEIISQEADALVRYISVFENSSPEFLSEKEHVSFADLRKRAEIVRDLDIGNNLDIVNYYMLTKKPSERITYEEVRLDRAKTNSGKMDGRVVCASNALNTYNNSTNYMIASKDALNLVNNNNNEFYGALANKLVQSKAASISARYKVEELQKNIDKLNDTEFYKLEKAALEKDIVKASKEAYKEMMNIRKIVKSLAEENYNINVGSKIYVSKTSYEINMWGNIILNFICMILLVSAVAFMARYTKDKGTDYFKEAISVKINSFLNKYLISKV